MILAPEQLPIADYHNSAPRYWSKTALKDLAAKGPKWVYGAYITKEIKRERPGGALQGLALDCLLTEGDEAFDFGWAIRPDDLDGRTKDGKEWAVKNAHKQILSAKDGLILSDAADAVTSHPIWDDIQKCQSQLSIRQDWSPGLGLQSRPDWINLQDGVYIDLKKTADLDRFPQQAYDLGYILQAAVCKWALEREGTIIKDYYLVAAEWERASRCRAYRISEFQLSDATMEMERLMGRLCSHLESGEWDEVPLHHQDLPNSWRKGRSDD